MIEYYPIVTGALGENCYLVWQGETAWIIDPGADAEEIIAEVKSRGLLPTAIVLTHGHFDHIGALDALMKQWPSLPVILRKEDAAWAFTHPFNQYPPLYMHPKPPATLRSVEEETVSCGGLSARLLHTPGHTPGGICVLFERDDGLPPLCFTGDTLFKDSVGRTDLPGGSFLELNRSLRFLAETLPPSTTLLSGHGAATTMERELRFNPYLREDEGF